MQLHFPASNDLLSENGVVFLRRYRVLELKNVTIRLKSDGRKLVDQFSFTLQKGDKAVIIGEEGNGKSTLLKFIYDREMIRAYCDWEGVVVSRKRMAYLPQMLPAAYCNQTLAEFFEDKESYRYMDVLSQLGLTLDFIYSDQTLGSLSGGEKVKVQLAKLCMEEPDLLLLDEPTNDLDIPTLKWLEQFISASKIPILFISHDETLIEKTANVILHMEQLIRKSVCRISVIRCPYREYLSRRQRQFEHQEQVAQKQRDDYDKQMEKWQQIYNRVDHEQRTITRQNPGGARLLKKKMHAVMAMGKRFERERENFLDFPEQEDAILTKFDENIHLPHSKTILDFTLDSLAVGSRRLSRNIQLHVSGNQHIGITGRNGAGKSTLLALIWSELKERKDITVSYMPQEYHEILDYEKTPIEFLAESQTKEVITKARTFMGSMRFTHEEMTGRIGNLSGGQKAKILFLDMVLKQSDVLLLDEPTRNFSPLSGPVVRDALKRFGGAIISISHDRKYLREACDIVYELTENGLQAIHAVDGVI